MPLFFAGFDNSMVPVPALVAPPNRFFMIPVAPGSQKLGGLSVDAYFCPSKNETVLGLDAATLFGYPRSPSISVGSDLVISVRNLQGGYDQLDITIPASEVRIDGGVHNDLIRIGGEIVAQHFELLALHLKSKRGCYDRRHSAFGSTKKHP